MPCVGGGVYTKASKATAMLTYFWNMLDHRKFVENGYRKTYRLPALHHNLAPTTASGAVSLCGTTRVSVRNSHGRLIADQPAHAVGYNTMAW